MANQHYTLITESTLTIKDKTYVVDSYNSNLEEFLNKNAGKEIYILETSILTETIQAIVI